MTRVLLQMLLFATALAVAAAKMARFDAVISNEIHLLRPRLGGAGEHVEGSCQSWRFGVETNNVIGWKRIPKECEDYVGHYMLGKEYRDDSSVITREALLFAKSLNISGKVAWVFDVDETTLSNLPYYARHGFGVELFNATAFNEWVFTGKALALPESLELYKRLVSLGVKIVFLTGRAEDQRTVTEANLKRVGFTTWDKLLLKGSEFEGKTAVEYKSAERKKVESEGYTIIGNMGDQWSDLLGTNTGLRTFKLPDPMYYIS